VLTKNHIKK